MDEPAQTRSELVPQPTDPVEHNAQERFPLSTRDMIRQIYLLSGAVIVLLSLVIWLMISLS